ncbi:unnamed protein product, partial [Meganyctiphanes norvegica]
MALVVLGVVLMPVVVVAVVRLTADGSASVEVFVGIMAMMMMMMLVNISKIFRSNRSPKWRVWGLIMEETTQWPSYGTSSNKRFTPHCGTRQLLLGPTENAGRPRAVEELTISQRTLNISNMIRDYDESSLLRIPDHNGADKMTFTVVKINFSGSVFRLFVLELLEGLFKGVISITFFAYQKSLIKTDFVFLHLRRYDRSGQESEMTLLQDNSILKTLGPFYFIQISLITAPSKEEPGEDAQKNRYDSSNRQIFNMPQTDHLQQLLNAYPDVPSDVVSRLLSLGHTLRQKEAKGIGLPDFPLDNLHLIAAILEKFPSTKIEKLLQRLYPHGAFLAPENQKSVEDVLETFDVQSQKETIVTSNLNEARGVRPNQEGFPRASVTLKVEGKEYTAQVVSGSSWVSSPPSYVLTPYHQQLLTELLQSHSAADFCIIGPRGCGKSAAVAKVAHMLGYQTEPILLYQDMTSRDLVQQRVTSAEGDTSWQFAPLIKAAMEGKLAILDGIHRLHHGTLAVLHRLLHDREIQLYDGTRLIHHDRYESLKAESQLTDSELTIRGVFPIHPSFRVVALAEPPIIGGAQGQWLTPESLTLFLYHSMRPLTQAETRDLLTQLTGACSPEVEQLIGLSHRLGASSDPSLRSLSASLSLRQIIRMARHFKAYPAFDLHTAVYKACLARFLPPLAKQALDKNLLDAGINKPESLDGLELACDVAGDTLRIGNTHAKIYNSEIKTKIPDTLFFNIKQHVSVLEAMLQDWLLGEHLLLVGNQGVGKNKLADRFLYLLQHPREYIQLHRDTTVQSLTIQPVVRDGIIHYEDSPLVTAVKTGNILVVDEADKAPTHVTCIFKTLVESGEMLLSDGRRIVPASHPLASIGADNIIISHPDFRMIVLANRPGFPFLGNDFFGSLGDLFSCHSIDNPSVESEMALLRSYGPDVGEDVMRRLVAAFGELRNMADQGLIQYPYSTREVVNIIKHLQEFPDEGVAGVVSNVFDFDSWSGEAKETLIRVMHRHGIPVGTSPNSINLAVKLPLGEPVMSATWQVIQQRPNAKAQLIKLPVETSNIKYKSPLQVSVYHDEVDISEARAAVFSEQHSYWPIPIYESATVTDIAVTTKGTDDSLDDSVHIATVTPVALYSVVPRGGKSSLRQVLLHDLFPWRGGPDPRLYLTDLPDGRLALHDETSNTFMLFNLDTGMLYRVQQSSFLEEAADHIIKKFSAKSGPDGFFRMCKDEAKFGRLALFEVNGGRLVFLDFNTDLLHSINLPLKISSIHNLGGENRNQWLVIDRTGDKWILKGEPNDPCPYALHPINQVSNNDEKTPGKTVTHLHSDNLSDFVISTALKQKISSPSRLLAPTDSLAAITVGFPELDYSSNEYYHWPRTGFGPVARGPNPSPTTAILPDAGQIVRVTDTAPENAWGGGAPPLNCAGYLEVTDLVNHSLSYVPVPRASEGSHYSSWVRRHAEKVLIAPASGQGVATVDHGGVVRLWQTGTEGLRHALSEWQKMIGHDTGNLRLEVEKSSGLDVSSPKHGKEDPENTPHVGGNTWAGGTGGRDTAGLGGKGGPYRLDAGHDVTQLPQWEKDAVPEEVRKAAREMGQKAFKERLKEIQMSEYDAGLYEKFSDGVKTQVKSLRGILSSLQAKGKERQWLKHRSSGELDDTKLIEGLAGERNIYRQRREEEPEVGAPMTRPKRLRVVVDVSGSMYRFNGHDGRLERELEVVLMVMEAFEGFENKFQYEIYGHSGEDDSVPLVRFDRLPCNNKERLDILKTMQAHSQFCLSGDHTLEAARNAVQELGKVDADEKFVILLSDANLERYGIHPRSLTNILTSDPNVNTFAIFIGSLGNQADRLTQALPAGRSFVCLNLKSLPQIMQSIFTSAIVK